MRAARILACLGFAAMVGGCLDETGIYCEVFDYNGRRTVLAVPKEYYALPRVDDKSGISLYVRYSNLKPKAGPEDFTELTNPAWRVATSNKSMLLGIERHRLAWPASLDDIIAMGYRDAHEVPTDWQGWQKIEMRGLLGPDIFQRSMAGAWGNECRVLRDQRTRSDLPRLFSKRYGRWPFGNLQLPGHEEAALRGVPSSHDRIYPQTRDGREGTMCRQVRSMIGFDGKGGAVIMHCQTLEQIDDIIGKLGS